MSTTAKPAKPALPPGIQVADTKLPEYNDMDFNAAEMGRLTFYETPRGWCIATLKIGNGRNGYADRTYAITLEGTACRVGRGPHVKQVVTVYVRHARKAALQRYLDLWTKGMEQAGTVRDRISSRRAEGQVRRARGEYSWRWSN